MSKLKEMIHQYVVEALEEILSEEAEQISEARKLIKHYKSPEADMGAKVYKNPETGEHEVDFYKNGKNLGEGPRYYTDSLQDAHATAQTELKRMQKRHPVEEGVRREGRIAMALGNLPGGNDPTNIRNRDALTAALRTTVNKNIRSRAKRTGLNMRQQYFRTPESDPHDQNF